MDFDKLSPVVAEVYKQLGTYDYSKFNEECTEKKQFFQDSLLADGSHYTGQYLPDCGVKEGVGQMIMLDGTIFEGLFKDNSPVFGRMILKNGDSYEGI